MNNSSRSGINPEKISEYMNRALSIAQELNYRLECADMTEEISLLYEQTRCCLKTLAQVQNSLEIAQYDGGRVRQVRFNLSDSVDDIVSLVRSRMRKSPIKIESDTEKSIDCIGDPDRFAACFVNILVNALQNVDREEGEVKVVVRKRFDCALVSVIDNGYGMTQFQLEQSLRSDGGKGFDVLKRFCGSVGTSPLFETTENGGFSVTLKVPLAPPPEKLELHSDYIPPKIGPTAPCTALIYKLDEAAIVL